jgi:hypothetical protein
MTTPEATVLDDYLGLLDQPLAPLRLVVFHGASGSGKSSQIALLRARHPELAGRDVVVTAPDSLPSQPVDILVIEEIEFAGQLACLWPALRRARLVLAACHVDPAWLWPWRLAVRSRCHRLDRQAHKLASALHRRGVRHTPAALAAFVDRFGANYTDLDIVLEHAGVDDLDRALALFARGGRIRHHA